MSAYYRLEQHFKGAKMLHFGESVNEVLYSGFKELDNRHIETKSIDLPLANSDLPLIPQLLVYERVENKDGYLCTIFHGLIYCDERI